MLEECLQGIEVKLSILRNDSCLIVDLLKKGPKLRLSGRGNALGDWIDIAGYGEKL